MARSVCERPVRVEGHLSVSWLHPDLRCQRVVVVIRVVRQDAWRRHAEAAVVLSRERRPRPPGSDSSGVPRWSLSPPASFGLTHYQIHKRVHAREVLVAYKRIRQPPGTACRVRKP